MVERQVVLPVPRDEVWTALTDPDQLGAWFGAEVEWELRPGGAAHFSSDDGSKRQGVVESVDHATELRFRWWPTDSVEEPPSEVTYTLEDDDDGTRLTITEQPLDPAVAQASCVQPSWDDWDGRLVGLWARAEARVHALA